MRLILLLGLLMTGSICMTQSVQLQYDGNNEKIKAAVANANEVLRDPIFYKSIDSVERFDHSTFSGVQVSAEMQRINRVIIVKQYWAPLGANAKTVSKIKMNTAKLGRSHASIVHTLIHEAVHAVDWWTNNEFDYTHDGNAPDGQGNTAPWVIGAIGERMVI